MSGEPTCLACGGVDPEHHWTCFAKPEALGWDPDLPATAPSPGGRAAGTATRPSSSVNPERDAPGKATPKPAYLSAAGGPALLLEDSGTAGVGEDPAVPAAKVYAYELAPEPLDSQPCPPEVVARYHLARAAGLWLGWMGHSDVLLDTSEHARRFYVERLNHVIAETGLALLLYAVVTGESDPVEWARMRNHEESGEWVWQCGKHLGLDMDRIKPYLLVTAP